MNEYNGFIYETINMITGHKYIGRHGRSGDSNDPDDSWYLGSGVAINDAIEKYGKENFRRIIIDPGPLTLKEAIAKESYYLELYDCENNPNYYNLTNTSHEGYPVLKGENHPMYGVHRYGKDNPMYGKHHTEETKKKLSNIAKERPIEIKEKFFKSTLGRSLSEEHKEKLRIASIGNKYSLGYKHSDEHNKKISESLKGENNPMYGKTSAMKGRHHTEDSIEKIRKANLGRVFSEETIEKMRKNNIGEGNPMYGKICVNDGSQNKMINPLDLEDYLHKGYSRGRISKK